MLPNVAIVDPALLKSLPSHVAASAGLDALSQGIESYWSIHSTEASQAKAREAIVNAWTHLARFVNHPDDTARLGMALAAHLAGEAISVTRTTAPHAVSYPITAHYGVSHGHAVGLILPAIFIYNGGVSDQDCLHSKGPRHVRGTLTEIANLLDAETPTEAAQRYQSLMDEIGLTSDLRTLGIGTPGDIDTIVDNGFNPERVNNGPRRLTADALRQMLAARMPPIQRRRNDYGRQTVPRDRASSHPRPTQGR